MPALASTSWAAVNAMIIPRNHRKPAVHAVSCSGQSILTPGGASAMSRAKWIKSPVTTPASTARCRRLTAAAPATTSTVNREC